MRTDQEGTDQAEARVLGQVGRAQLRQPLPPAYGEERLESQGDGLDGGDGDGVHGWLGATLRAIE